MTVVNKIQQALVSAQGLSAQLKTFSMDTEDQQAKQSFSQLAQSAENIMHELQSRLDYLQSQEPQYRQQQ
ncbi:DUF1657 domain-containing protein [Clostridium sp. Cult2]|uniref:DUF1657 domain-containing protein n=1 Tax=Clostridium sp. Cult2 TaxID=2079003 RepID=UPI001F26FE8A|nr:DUF1657 domain-containing protein [Clostridium sp. Cult2]MCF6464361.1 hypothetical protein [Clostridium sp. Cult2]